MFPESLQATDAETDTLVLTLPSADCLTNSEAEVFKPPASLTEVVVLIEALPLATSSRENVTTPAPVTASAPLLDTATCGPIVAEPVPSVNVPPTTLSVPAPLTTAPLVAQSTLVVNVAATTTVPCTNTHVAPEATLAAAFTFTNAPTPFTVSPLVNTLAADTVTLPPVTMVAAAKLD